VSVLVGSDEVSDSRLAGLRWTDRSTLRLPEVRWSLIAAALFAAGGTAQLAGAPAGCWWAFYLACYACGGWEPGWAGLQALRHRVLDVDLLMVLAAIVAASIGQVLDGALLILIFATSGALEAIATARTAESVRALLDLTPELVSRVQPDGSEQRIGAGQVQIGDLIVVRPGERIGADGVVVSGASDVDQSSITGEPLPAVKEPGGDVFAGTMNGSGALRVQVKRRADESVIARIVALVEQASASKAKLQMLIERVEQRYSVGMVGATVLLFVVPLALGRSLQSTLLRAMTFMIVASPCAVVLATMPPLLAAIANAGRHGILVKSAVVMELLGRTNAVAFDKTGTLTEGAPVVDRVIVLSPAVDEDQILAWAAAAELNSEHPLGRAVVSAALERQLLLPAADGFTAAPGLGVTAEVGSRRVQVGSLRLLSGVTPVDKAATPVVEQAESDGNTAVVVVVDDVPVGVIALSDRLRQDAVTAVSQLTVLTGARPVLLTGDAAAPAARIAGQAGIDQVHAGLLPEDKVAQVQRMQDEGRRVLLVGDGVNDAPAMATAELGLAMGGRGSDLTLQTADAITIRDELSAIPAVIALSQRARRLVMANLVVAGTVIAGLVTWDLIGTLPLPLGVAGHEGSTVIVGLNGLRLLRRGAWVAASRPVRRQVTPHVEVQPAAA
jgi:heavy metal translocating P-type ATPase